jgi:phage regulator Rha-like protein
MPKSSNLIPIENIAHRILLLRGQKVLLDADLAELYGVETKRLNEQVKRNSLRFPPDFIFTLSQEEFANLKSQSATSSWGGRRKLPLAFTEHGAIMAATILNSPRAVEVSVFVVRAFVQLREALANNHELSKRLEELEKSTAKSAFKHDSLAHNTRVQFKEAFDALRELMTRPEQGSKRPIGFVISEEKDVGPKSSKKRTSK